MLTHIDYTALNTKTHYAVAQLAERHHSYDKRQWQRHGVRTLLQNLLTTLNMQDTLNDTQFPYRLNDSGYYVCFSHSNDKVAVTISSQRSTGIDIEVQDIKWQVVERFYHTEETSLLLRLPLEQRSLIARWLWQIKESFIKINQHTLAQGLSINYSATIPVLLTISADAMSAPIVIKAINHPLNNTESGTECNNEGDNKSNHREDHNYQIMIIPQQQLVIIY